MNQFTVIISFSWLLLFSSLTMIGQSTSTDSKQYGELGMPYMQHYERSDYKAKSDNQALVQGDNGLMYIGNGNGVLEFDGIDWRLIRLPNRSPINTLTKTTSGKIFVAGFNEIGFLKPDSLGFITFQSFKSNLDSIYQNFTYVQNSFSINEDVYFQVGDHLFRWANNTFKVWSPEHGLSKASAVNGQIYLQDSKNRILQLEDDELHYRFTIPYKIRNFMSADKNKILLSTIWNGIFFMKGHELIPFQTPMNDYFKKHGINTCRIMSNGWITIGTRSGGLVVLDKEGSLLHLIDKSKGLLNNMVLSQAQDDQGGLWLGLAEGISRIELISPFTIFDDRMGVSSYIMYLTRHKGRLFAASDQGLLILDPEEDSNTTGFESIAGSDHSYYLLEVDQSLLIAADNGVLLYDDEKIKKISQRECSALLRSRIDPSILYIGLPSGLAVMKKENGIWKDLGKIASIDDDIRELVELEDGKLWMESQVDGVWLIDFYAKDTLDLIAPVIKRFQANKQLPPDWLFLHSIRDEAVFEIDGTIYKYHSQLDSIMPDLAFGVPFGFNGDIVPKHEDKQGNLWMSAQISGLKDEEKQRTVSILQADGTYLVEHINDKRITHSAKKALYPDQRDVLWYGGPDGIIRQDLKHNKLPIEDFKTLVRKISVNGDSAVYGGSLTINKSISWEFVNNTLRFEYAAPSYDEIPQNRYQYYLDGYDKDWSDWTKETKKDYTQIPEGTYTFRVKAKNIYQQISQEGQYGFTILPPWFRTWWAYLLYLLTFIGFLLMAFRWRARRLKAENLALEKLVSERTIEVRKQTQQLEKQASKLLELDKVKSRFFANISHEFRTPLTLILGPLKDRLNQKLSSDDRQETSIMHRNAQRLQRLINQLLDLSKIESESLQLQVARKDIHFFLRAILSSFSSHAQQRGIQYETLIPQKELLGYFDEDMVEKIIYNLVSNAFKFTPDGGEITVCTQGKQGRIIIEVADSGSGIAPDKLDYIFDRFYQTDDSHTREHEGTGIGLALTKELISLHKGTIEVKSVLGEGSVFTVTLPLEASAYHKQDITEVVSTPPIVAKSPQEIERAYVPLNLDSNGDSDAPIVLVVEDHSELRQYIKKYLGKYQVLEAADGEQGLEMAIKSIPDLIISDVMMPKMDGVAMLQALKTNEKTSHIPVILLTAKADLPSKMEGLETGADDYLTKPFDAGELQVRCENLIEQRRLLRERFSSTVILKPKDIAITSTDEVFLNKIMDITEQYLDDSSFSVEVFQREVGMSRMQLHRKLKALTDYSTTEFIRVQRLKRAAQLLADSDASISDICYRVGFNSLSYFTKCFKEQYGTTPSDYAFEHHS